MAVLTDAELMPWWVAAGLQEHPGERVLDLPEVPEWLLEAPVSTEEPCCDCGRVTTHEPAAAVEPVRWAVPGVWGDEPVSVVPSVGQIVEQLRALAERLAAVDPTGLTADRALGEAQEIARVQHQLRVLQLARTDDVKSRELFAHLGYRSLAAWQRHVAPDTPGTDRVLSRRMVDYPSLAEALREQRVSFHAAQKTAGALAKVRGQLDRPDGLIDGQPGEPVVEAVVWNVLDLICRDRFGVEHDPTRDPAQAALLTGLQSQLNTIVRCGGTQRERVERAFVLLAEQLRPAALGAAFEELVDALLPSLLEDRELAAQDNRALSLKPHADGTWELQAILTPEAGEQLHTALAAEARRDPANPLDTHAREQARATGAEQAGQGGWSASQDRPGWEQRALHEHGQSLRADSEQLVPRSPSKRLHDAFGRLLTRYLSAGLGGVSGKVPVQVTITASARLVEGSPGALPAKGGSGRPLARSLLRRWWCDAHITTILMSAGWKPLGIVHSARTITGTELKAARAQFDNRCPGLECCPAQPDPLIPLVPHHVRRHSEHGTTSLEETLLVCDRLHHDLHTGKRTIRLRDDRLITENGWLEGP